MIVYVLETLALVGEDESVTVTVKVKAPVVVGMPLMFPVAELIPRPGGSSVDGDVNAQVQVSGGVVRPAFLNRSLR